MPRKGNSSAIVVARLLGTEGFTEETANQVKRYWMNRSGLTDRQKRQLAKLKAELSRIAAGLSEGDRLILGKFIGLHEKMGFDVGLKIGIQAFATINDKDVVEFPEKADFPTQENETNQEKAQRLIRERPEPLYEWPKPETDKVVTRQGGVLNGFNRHSFFYRFTHPLSGAKPRLKPPSPSPSLGNPNDYPLNEWDLPGINIPLGAAPISGTDVPTTKIKPPVDEPLHHRLVGGFGANDPGPFVTPSSEKATAPHCDPLILHAPKTCEFCDMYPGKQQQREIYKINFTGENKPGFSKCPSELRRPLEVINQWPNNRPAPKTCELKIDKEVFLKK